MRDPGARLLLLMPDALRLSPAQLDSIFGHVITCKPEEAFGILAGDSDGTVKRIFLMENIAHSDTFYEMDSQEQFQVFDEMKHDSLELVAIFHSHPHSAAYPSRRDIELAFYPESIYFIVTLMNNKPEARAFRIRETMVEEIDFVVAENHA